MYVFIHIYIYIYNIETEMLYNFETNTTFNQTKFNKIFSLKTKSKKTRSF